MKKIINLFSIVCFLGVISLLLSTGSVVASAAEPETAVSWRFYESEVLKEEVTDIAVSPDGENINFATEDGEEYIVNGLTDEQFEQVSEDIKSLHELDFTDKKESDNNEDVVSIRELIGLAVILTLFFIACIEVSSIL